MIINKKILEKALKKEKQTNEEERKKRDLQLYINKCVDNKICPECGCENQIEWLGGVNSILSKYKCLKCNKEFLYDEEEL